MDGFHGVAVTGQLIKQWLPDFTTAGAVKTGEVEMGPVSVALKATKGRGVSCATSRSPDRSVGPPDGGRPVTKIYAPNTALQGERAGVVFKDGVGETDDPAPLAYFTRAGYGIGAPATVPQPAPAADARDFADQIVVGTPLRDAAVDPRARDFLAPTNAGEADPHGPLVVAPGLHAVPPTPIAPGDVHVDDTDRQDDIQTGLAQAVLVEGPPATEPVAQSRPGRPRHEARLGLVRDLERHGPGRG